MIRDLGSGDLEAVARMLSRIREAAPWSTDDFLLASRRNLSLRVAEEDGAVCGLIVFRTVVDEAEIMNVAVDLSRRRRGTGSGLINDVVGACRVVGVRKIFLEVRDSNVGAQNFYSRMGFIEVGRRRQYYSQPVEDALVLARQL